MKILVDTSVWSLAFRKKDKSEQDIAIINTLNQFIMNDEVVMIGAIRQEILSGIRHDKQFKALQAKLNYFTDLTVTTNDYILAADCFNQCRRKGVQGSHIDFLICAVAIQNKLPIFTLDKDFTNYQNILDIQLISF